MRLALIPPSAACLLALVLAGETPAQPSSDPARMADFLERMDGNRDGRLDRSEISDHARPYVERFVREVGLDPSRPIYIRDVRERLRRQSDSRSGGSSAPPQGGHSTPVLLNEPLTVPGFGQVEDHPVPGFGEGGVGAVRIEQQDLNHAKERMERYDRNRDGYIDQREISEGRWSDDPLQYDRNRDGRISLQEMAMRYAVRRVNESGQQGGSSSSGSSSYRPQSSQGSRPDNRQDNRQEQQRPSYSAADREAWALAESMMDRYDVNNNRALDRSEWGDLGFKSSIVDTNGDDRVDRAELAQWLLRQSAHSQRLPDGLPLWFARRDLDGDGQVVMAEFADEWDDETAEQFMQYDRNGDGVIVPDECLSAANLPAGAYVNHQFQIIPPRSTIYSDIVVSEDDRRQITDLNIQLSITHTHDDFLDVYLIGPGGERVELFTGVGESDDHFANTILDDEAQWPIVRGRPPFSGRYRPEAALKDQPSLRQFNGRAIAGTWTLMVQAERSDRPGALHGWSLMAELEGGGPSGEAWQDGDRTGVPDYGGGYEDRREGDRGAEGGDRGGPPGYRPGEGYRGGPPGFRPGDGPPGFRPGGGPPGFRPSDGDRGGPPGGGPPGDGRPEGGSSEAPWWMRR